MVDQALTLGTLFTGKVDATFRKATSDLKILLDRLHGASTGVSTQMGRTGAVTGKTKDEFTQMNRQLSRVTGGFQRLTAAAKVTFAYGLAASAIFGFINTLKSAISVIFEYDQALKNLQAITLSTNAEVAAMGVEIKRVASITKYSAQEVAEATIILAQAGFTTSEVLASINAVAMLATGTLSNMADTADLLTTAIRAFGEDASESGRIADIFANVVNFSKATIDKLRTSFNYLGPISRLAGLSLEEVGAGAMILYNAGLRASTVGTGFRQILSRLVNPSEKLRLIIKATGADIEKLNPGTATFVEMIGELEKMLGNAVPAAIRAQRAFQMFGLRGAAPAAAFAQAGVAGLQDMLDKVYQTGSAAKMAEIQMEGLGVMAKNLMDKIQLLAVAIGEGGIGGAFAALLGVLRPFVDLLTLLAETYIGKMIIAITSLTTVLLLSRITIKYVIVQLSALALGYNVATIKAMMLATHQNMLTVALAATSKALKSLWTAMLANPFIVITAGLAAIAVGLLTWIRHQKQAKEELEESIITMEAEVSTLKKYQEKLKETEEDERGHSAAMDRLIKQYPELIKVVNLATKSFTDEGEALKKLIKEKEKAKLVERASLAAEILRDKKRQSSVLKALEGRTELQKKSGEWRKQYDEAKAKIEGLDVEWKTSLVGMAEGIRMYGTGAASSVEEISYVLSAVMKMNVNDVKEYAVEISKFYKDLQKQQEESIKSNADFIAEQKKLLAGLGKGEWLELYESFKGDPGKEGTLLVFLDTLQKKITKMAEAGKNVGLIPAQIDAIIKDQYAKGFETFTKKQSEAQRAQEKFQDTMLRDLLEYNDKARKADELGALMAKKERDEKIQAYEDQTKIREHLVLSERVYQAELLSIKEKYTEKEQAIYDELATGIAKTLEEKQAKELAVLDIKYIKLRKKAEEEVDDKERLKALLLTIEKSYQEERQSIIDDYQKREEKKHEQAEKKANKLWKDVIKVRIEMADEWLRQHKITMEQYLQILTDALEMDLIDYEEAYRRKIIVTGTWLEQFKYGLGLSLKETKSWGETIVEIGKDVAEKISSEFAQSFTEFIDGTKNAREAFSEFAKDVLRWLAEMIVKQMIFNAVSGFIRSFSPNFFTPQQPGYLPPVSGQGSYTAHAKGGVLSEDIIGMGVRTGKTHVLHKDETIIPAGEGKSSVNVKLIVNNNTGQPVKARQEKPRFDGQETIVTLWLDAFERNKMGLRERLGVS